MRRLIFNKPVMLVEMLAPRRACMERGARVGGLTKKIPRLRRGIAGRRGTKRREIESGFGERSSLREAQAALLQCLGKQLLDLSFFAILGHGQFAYQQVAGAFQHLLFTEGQLFALAELEQALEY